MPRKKRIACYLSVDIGAGEGVDRVQEQLDGFEALMARGGGKLTRVYSDVMTDERVPDFGDQAVACGRLIEAWGKRMGVKCSVAISVSKARPAP